MSVNRLKIAMLSIHSCPVGQLGTKDTGGMSVYIREVAKSLGYMGHQVDIFTRYHDPNHPKIMHLSKNVRLVHLEAGDAEDLSKLSVYPHVKSFALEVDGFCRQNQITYDMIHSHYWLSGLVGKYLQSWWDTPHMIMFHTLGAIKNRLKKGKPEPELRLCNEKALARYCHRIVAPTDTEKKYIVDFLETGEDKICTIPCGVDQALFIPGEKQTARKRLHLGLNDKVVLYVGRIEPLKGLDRILHSIARLNDKMPVKLVIIGGDQLDTEEMQEILALVKALQLENAVVFAGRIPQNHLPLYYIAADVLAVASLYESFGLVALEALSCGTPVVSTPVGGMKSLIQPGKNGFLVDDPSSDAMANAINHIFSQPHKDRTASSKIRESVLHLSWSAVTETILSEYQSLIKLHHSPDRAGNLPGSSTDPEQASCG